MIESRAPEYAVSDAEAQQLWDIRVDVESFLREMRGRGAWQIECIRAVRQFDRVSLAEAKEIVHYSSAWADMRESADSFHESLYEAVEQMQREDEAADVHLVA